MVNASTDVLSLFRVLGYGGPRPGRAQLRGLSARLMLRRRRCDPAPDGGPLLRLPEKREEDVVVPFATARERRRYARLLEDARRARARERADAGAARAAALVYLQKLCLACLFDADDVAGEEEVDAEEEEDDDDGGGGDARGKRRRPDAAPARSTKVGALLAVLPQHTSCFKGASFVQHQLLDVAIGGNVVYVDWLSAGRRHGRGENWDFESFESRALFKLGDAPVLLEGQHLFACLLYTSPSPRDATLSRMPSSA